MQAWHRSSLPRSLEYLECMLLQLNVHLVSMIFHVAIDMTIPSEAVP